LKKLRDSKIITDEEFNRLVVSSPAMEAAKSAEHLISKPTQSKSAWETEKVNMKKMERLKECLKLKEKELIESQKLISSLRENYNRSEKDRQRLQQKLIKNDQTNTQTLSVEPKVQQC
jgi:predicted transcriptional regulator